MDIEIRKLKLIESFKQIRDHAVLNKIESLLSIKTSKQNPSIAQFSGIWTEDEASEIRQIIEEGCEQINEDDWNITCH
ncbi:MAG: hypothetical protein RJQ09_18605 [Cyclobacteriaceae bacterium]